MRTILTLLLLLSPLKAVAHSYTQKGVASYYSHYEDGRETADGQRYSPYKYTAASKTIKLGTTIKVVNLRNGRSVYLLVNDRGPYVGRRILDVSWIAARRLGMLRNGTTQVYIYDIKKYAKARRVHEDTRLRQHRWLERHRRHDGRFSPT